MISQLRQFTSTLAIYMQRKCGVKCVKDVTYDLRQSFCFARAESNKHVEQVKPSYTAPFDI